MTRHHNRSVEAFHNIVQSNVEGVVVPSPLDFNNTCVKASYFYRSYVDRLKARHIPDDAFMVLTSEELEKRPKLTWMKFAFKAGLPLLHPGIKEFSNFRYNVQSIEAWYAIMRFLLLLLLMNRVISTSHIQTLVLVINERTLALPSLPSISLSLAFLAYLKMFISFVSIN